MPPQTQNTNPIVNTAQRVARRVGSAVASGAQVIANAPARARDFIENNTNAAARARQQQESSRVTRIKQGEAARQRNPPKPPAGTVTTRYDRNVDGYVYFVPSESGVRRIPNSNDIVVGGRSSDRPRLSAANTNSLPPVTRNASVEGAATPTAARREQAERTEPEANQPSGTFRENETGRVSGIQLPDGRTFFGLDRDEVQDIANQQSDRLATPTGTEELTQQPLSEQEQLDQLQGSELQDLFNLPVVEESPIAEPVQQQAAPQTTIGFITDALFNPLTVDPRTGQPVIDPRTGEPVQVAAGTFSLGTTAQAAAALPATTKTAILAGSVSKVQGAASSAKTAGVIGKLRTVAESLLFGGIAATVLGIEPFKDKAPFIQQSFNTLGERAAAISTDPVLTPEEKIRQLNNIQVQINEMEQTLKANTIENKRLANTKEMLDIQTDLFEKKQEVIEARNSAILQRAQQQFPEISEEVISRWISQASAEDIRRVEAEYRKQVERILKLQN